MAKRDPQLPGLSNRADDGAGLSPAAKVVGARKSRGAGHKWRCHRCGSIERYWARAERHADETHHFRIEVVTTEWPDPRTAGTGPDPQPNQEVTDQ